MGKLFYLEGQTEWICKECAKWAPRGKISRFGLCHGFMFPEIPPELRELSFLEALLIAPRICFMSIFAVGTYGQEKLKGAVVSVW